MEGFVAAAKVHEVVLKLSRPATPDSMFDTGADREPRSRFAPRTVKQNHASGAYGGGCEHNGGGHTPIKVAPCEACLAIDQGAAACQPQSPGHGAECA